MKKVILIGSKSAGEKNDANVMSALISPHLSKTAKVEVVYWEDLLFDISLARQHVFYEGKNDRAY